MKNCSACSVKLTSKYCPDCGRPAELERINLHYLIHEVRHVLHFERGFPYTLKELLIRPGENVRNYILENRNRLVKPLIFVVVTSLIYTVLNNSLHFQDSYFKFGGNPDSLAAKIFKWAEEHYGYANVMMAFFIALWIKIFFRKQQFNVLEILILLCFIMGVVMLIYCVFGILQLVIDISFMPVASILSIVYLTWAIGQFYGKRNFSSYLKAFGAYILGLLTFGSIIIGIAAIIDLFR